VGAAPVGRQARRRGVGAIVKAGIESAAAVGSGTGTGGEAVGAEVETGSVATAAGAGTGGTAVRHAVGTGGVRTACATGARRLPLGAGTHTVRVLISEKRAQSGSPLII